MQLCRVIFPPEANLTPLHSFLTPLFGALQGGVSADSALFGETRLTPLAAIIVCVCGGGERVCKTKHP